MAVEVTLTSGGLEDTVEHPSGPGNRSAENLQRGAALGRYLVIDVLGRGGMSVVYAAFDPELDRKVAIKLVRPDLEGGTEATARLLREAQAMAKVLHPHVVTVHDVGTWEGRVFLAMELIDGATLRQWLADRPHTRREVLALFNAAGQGLAAAHAAGLVHRDFKPDNVLVGRDGRPRVTDFGLVRPANAGAEPLSHLAVPMATKFDSNGVLTQAGAVLGTPAYMAPEQLLGQVADARADQFAFAVALYEALYGERPFEAHDFAATYQAVTNGEVRPPPAGSRVPRFLRRVLLRALSVRPGDRFASMEALLSELKKDPVTRARRLLLGAAVVVLAASGPAWVGWRAQREAHRCEASVQEFDGAWDPARRAQLAQVFSAPGMGPKAWDRVRTWADDYSGQWKSARVAACEASRSGTEDARLVAASGRCIEARRLQFKAVIDLLLTSDAAALALAERAFGGVGSVKACVGGISRIPGIAPSAGDPAIIEQIARARANLLIGNLEAGEAEAHRALESARSRGREALAGAALLELARAQHQRGLATEALATYRQALLSAEATGEGELAFDVRLMMGQVLTEYLERYDEGLWVLDEARAGAEQLSLPPERIALLLYQQASALEQADRPREALPLAERSLALSRANATAPGDLAEGLSSLANLHSDLGHALLSSRYYEEYVTTQQTTTLRLEDYAIPLAYSGEELVLVGDYQKGLARLQQARAVLGPVGGAAAQAVMVDSWISYAAAALGQTELSRRTRASVERRRGTLSQVHHVAEVWQMLAWVDLFEGRPSVSLRGSLEASRVLAPAVAFNRASVLENALGQVEALRRLGRFAEARSALAAALVQAAEHHTDLESGLAHARGLEVGLWLDLGHPAPEGAETAAASLAIEVEQIGGENPDLATTQLALGRAELARGHRAAGLVALEGALKSSERRPGDPFAIAEAQFLLAQALVSEPSTVDRARSLARSARTRLAALPEPGPLSKHVERWLISAHTDPLPRRGEGDR